VYASFSGAANFGVSFSNAVTEDIVQVTLAYSPNPALLNQPVTFTATVIGANGAMPTGSVSFFNGKTFLGTANLNADGTASFTTSSLSAGNHAITAVYSGDANYVSGLTPTALTVDVLSHIDGRLV
jgi:hypothetical protein